jgi:PmbA protein
MELGELTARAVEEALGAGAGDAEAYATEATKREIRVHGGSVESLSTATERGVGIRSWIAGRVGFCFGTDLSRQGVAELARRSAEAAAIADEDEFAGPPQASGSFPDVDGLRDPSVAGWPTERAVELALGVERAAREEDARVVGVEQAVYFDSDERVAIAGSRGIAGEYGASGAYAYLQALAEGESGRETGLGFGIGRGPADLEPAEIGAEGARRATAMIGAVKPESRACPVVLDPTVAASFVGLLGGAIGADAVQRGRSPLAGRVGEEVAGAAFVLHDDGLDPGGLDSSPFDAEGVARRRTELIAGGSLRTYLHDTYTARRGDAESTGSAGRSGYRTLPGVSASNLVVAPGGLDFEALLADAGEGVFVTDVAGLHSGVNPVTGVFSVGASGRAIRGGELAEPLREFTIASDLISMLRAVRAAGSAPRWVPFGGSVSTPPLLIAEMTVAGA